MKKLDDEKKKLGFDYLPLEDIDISISNVRKTNLEEGIDELASSIAEIGVQQPIQVFKKSDNRYELIIGQRRYLACKRLKLATIPAVITTVKDETDKMIRSFSENIHRLDLEYRDKMQVATELLSKLHTIDKVAERLGIKPSTVRNYLGYAAVPEPIKRMVDQGKLSASIALRIAGSISDEDKALRIAKKVHDIPRSEGKNILIDVARENPDKPLRELTRIARQRAQMKRITINVTIKVFKAIVNAAAEYQTEKEYVVKEALEEWLKRRGFI